MSRPRLRSTSVRSPHAYGLHHLEVSDVDELRAAVAHGLASEATQLIHVRTSRAENVELHRAVWSEVGAALGGA